MKKPLVIIFSVTALLAVYKWQHIKPVDDPKDSPIFQQRLKSSLDRFQENEFPVRQDRTQARTSPVKTSPYPRPSVVIKDLVVSGRCSTVTLTWVEEKRIEKEDIQIKRKAPNGEYAILKTAKIYEREEDEGTRYWASDSGLTDGLKYQYLISMKDQQGKEVTRGPASINLTCNEKDREMLAQREKMVREYYQKKGVDSKDFALRTPPSPSTRSLVRTRDVVISGRCGKVSITWLEEKRLDKEKITIRRRASGEAYSLLKGQQFYDREEEGGVRYWTSDSGLTDGKTYEYLVSCENTQGKEMVKKPVSITLTCNARDKEILAQREKMIKEYYQKKGIDIKNYDGASQPPSYQLSKEIYNIDIGNSPFKGRKDAPVTLVVFTDFECIHCSTWADTLETMQKIFPKDIKIVFKNYPVSYHKQAELAALSALAAREQGKFWEMHDLLFKNYNTLSKEDILSYAKALGLNLLMFEKSLENKELKVEIDRDKAQGKTLGVQNAPTTFINGRRMVGSPPVSYIKGVIEDVLGYES